MKFPSPNLSFLIFTIVIFIINFQHHNLVSEIFWQPAGLWTYKVTTGVLNLQSHKAICELCKLTLRLSGSDVVYAVRNMILGSPNLKNRCTFSKSTIWFLISKVYK